MRYISLFSGIGAFEKALENIGIKINLKNFCEIDKYASQTYCAVHNVDKKLNLNDITEIDIEKLPTSGIDIITHGSPCQDFSMAGLQAGGDIGTGTRSSLMWNSVAIIEHVKPKYVVWENVKNVLSKKHKHNFDKYLKSLENLGYNNYYQVLNAKDFGIPQNRERIYVISIRKDIDKGTFTFPEKEPLKLKLKDLLEDSVDEKFYLKDSQVMRIKNSTYLQGQRRIQEKEWCDTLCARDWKDPKCVRVCKNNQSKNIEDIRIRKLTPRECWRLMGFSDEDFNKAQNTGISDTQLYKQAGNSIVVPVLEAIFKNLF